MYIAIVSIILFVITLQFIDRYNIENHKPPITMAVKSGVLALCFVATASVFTLFGEESIVTEEVQHLNYINQDIETGFPEF